MKEIGTGIIAFLLGVSIALFFVTADHASWFLAAEPPQALRSTTAEGVPEEEQRVYVPQPSGNISVSDYKSLLVDTAGCVRCCAPALSEKQGPCVKACVYDGPQDVFRSLCPSDVLKE